MKDDNPVKTLKELAAKNRRTPSRCQVFDANVCSTQATPDRPWELVAVSGEPFTSCLRFRYGQRKVRAFASPHYLAISFDAELPFEPVSVNEPNKNDPAQEFATEARFLGRAYTLFARDGQVSQKQKQLTDSAEFAELVHATDLQPEESLQVTRGDVSVYLRKGPCARVDLILAKTDELLDKLQAPPFRLDRKRIPDRFRALAPLIEEWAMSDDFERQSVIQDADRGDLEDLVNSVNPYFDSINEYLSSFGDRPLDEGAIALGSLAEAAHEAMSWLGQMNIG